MSVTPSISGVGASSPILLRGVPSGALLPAVVCAISAGATLAYNVEATAATPDPVTGQLPNDNWAPIAGAAGLTSSAVVSLLFKATAIRANITSFTGGQLSFAVAQ